MNELALAKKAIPAIVGKIAPELAKAVPVITEAVKTYGCRNQVAITQMVVRIFPEFTKYSETVLTKLNEALEIVAESKTENYDLVIQMVLSDDLATLDEKVKFFTMLTKSEIELENSRAINFTKKTAVVGTAGMGLIGAGSGAAVIIIKALANATEKAAKAHKEGKFLFQILKFFKK